MKLNDGGGVEAKGGEGKMNGGSPVGKLKLGVPFGAENGVLEPGKEMPKNKDKEKEVGMGNNGGMMSPESLEAS